MRLRYLRVNKQPPLHDVEIVFGRNQILDRASTVHFVVGVNGSGKSRLLQVLADIFTQLHWQQLPSYPVALAYDFGTDEERHTILIQRKEGPLSQSRLIEFSTVLPDYSASEWQELLEAEAEDGSLLGNPLRDDPFAGNALPGTGSIQRYIPWMLVYTSGVVDRWRPYFLSSVDGLALALPPYNPDEASEISTRWSRPTVPDNVIDPRMEEMFRGLPAEMQDSMEMYQQAKPQRPGKALLVEPEALKSAVFAVTLKQAIADFGESFDKDEQLKLIADLEQSREDGQRQSGLRGLLNEVGWLWPVSVTLNINYSPAGWARHTVVQIRDLYRQASNVVAEPQSPMRRLVFDLFAPAKKIDEQNNPIDDLNDVNYVAEALYQLLGKTGEDAQPKAFDVYRQLQVWQQEGILLDLEITLRKQHVDSLLRYDWLSDGERVFLGRMALFQLLAGQDDALFILDEPETHFNDVWKREIVDIIDDSLRDDASEVVIATHSSIALTDVFDEEIVLLRKEDGNTVATNVRTPTFGADPSEIMVNVFGAEDSIGKRALEFLERWLNKDWTPDERELLERIVKNVGPGLHRSELREILRELNAASNSHS